MLYLAVLWCHTIDLQVEHTSLLSRVTWQSVIAASAVEIIANAINCSALVWTTKYTFIYPLKVRILVMLRSTPKLRSLCQKNNTFHIEALYRSLILFEKSTWSMTSEASFAWKPRDCFSIWFKWREPQCRFLYIILHYNVLALFFYLSFFYRNLYIELKNELWQWNNKD